MEKVHIPIQPAYDVIIGRGLIDQADDLLAPYITGRKVMIITDANVASFAYPDRLQSRIQSLAHQVHQLIFPAGETTKNLANVGRIFDYLAQVNFSRNDYLIALGGGVVGDLAGFAAACYLRGINFFQMPTTLLAAIDSSVGGKTGVDIAAGKNLVGAFYQPKVVLCDLDSLKTLASQDFQDGMAEMIKYGLIDNPALVKKLNNRDQPLNAEAADLIDFVKTCVTMKRDIASQDAKDHGVRQLLNYGHTLGHALEQVSNYQISHGRAVALDMSVFVDLAVDQGILADNFRSDLDGLLKDYQLLTTKPQYDFDELKTAMSNDKKRRQDEITLVLPDSLGHCGLYHYQLEDFYTSLERVWAAYDIQ
ncbi:hypothetical protein AWM75_01005 [Aerococcus urinaehominis]|uniref:3-dehydroquinate synthase n=1 Tax=Aerococcus urinaehominis TaxID=128944 RepID=A0A0X8FJV3_9LACT|nr:3-dehydroquinate synthase [Aerococcus urinaehominis]AMB98657.1 hypothetical protein AWM75_01005 [Aerococcus urinaehominis]SDL97319.1 3-dehydroquinate synthase [Aerococcus urinaehominis]